MTWLGKFWNKLKTVVAKKIVQHSKIKSNWLPVEPSEHRWASTPATHKSYLFNDSGSWSTLELEHIFKRGSWSTPSRPASLPGPRQRGGTVRKGRSRFQTNSNLAKPGWPTRLLLLPRTLLLLYQRVSPANFTCYFDRREISIAQYFFHFMINKKIGPLYSSMWQQQGNWNGCGDLTLDHWTVWFFSSTRLLKYSGLVFL